MWFLAAVGLLISMLAASIVMGTVSKLRGGTFLPEPDRDGNPWQRQARQNAKLKPATAANSAPSDREDSRAKARLMAPPILGKLAPRVEREPIGAVWKLVRADARNNGGATVDNMHALIAADLRRREEEQASDEKTAIQVWMICQAGETNAELVGEWYNHPPDEFIMDQHGRYIRWRERALTLARTIADEFHRSAAMHKIVDLCMTAKDFDEAKLVFASITIDSIRKAISESHPALAGTPAGRASHSDSD